MNHLLFMDDFKIFRKDEHEVNELVSTVQKFGSKDIGVKFGSKKCGVLLMRRGEVVSSDGVELANGETVKDVDEDGYTEARQDQGEKGEAKPSARIPQENETGHKA